MKTHRRRNEGGEENTLFLLPALRVKEVSPPEQADFLDVLLLQNSGSYTVQDWGRCIAVLSKNPPEYPGRVIFSLEGYFWFIQEGALPLLIKQAAWHILGDAESAFFCILSTSLCCRDEHSPSW